MARSNIRPVDLVVRGQLRIYCRPTLKEKKNPGKKGNPMKRWTATALVAGMMCAGMAADSNIRPAHAADTQDDQSVLQADHDLVAALGKADKSASTKFLDVDFMWTNSAGATLSRAKVLGDLPKPPLGDETGIQVTEYTYGQVGEVRVARGKMYILRVWVKRPEGWRILHYHEVALAEQAGSSALSANDCENPCKDLPYPPKDEAEKGIRASWAGLELALTDHDTKAWSPHFPEEYLMATSGATGPITKKDRIATISKPGSGRVTLCRPLWAAGKLCESQMAAVPPARIFHFGDTVVIISRNKPYIGKPELSTRIWHLDHEGIWQMMESWDTEILSAAAVVPKP